MNKFETFIGNELLSRRSVLASTAAALVAMMTGGLIQNAAATTTPKGMREMSADNGQSP